MSLPPLPTEDELDGDAVGFNQGVFKQAQRKMRAFLARLLGTSGGQDEAIAALKVLDPEAVFNLKPVFSVGSSALTATFKDKDGNDLSADNLGFVAQRSATLSDAGFDLRKIAANIALTIPSTATLGHFDGVPAALFWYLIQKDADTTLVAVSGKYMGRSGLYTTVEVTTGADSAEVLYSSELVTDKPGRLVAVTGDTQATAGTWAALPSAAQPAPLVALLEKCGPGSRIINGKIVLTHNSPTSNKLTIALKTEAGNDPSLHDPVIIAFRSSTLTSSQWVFRVVIGALSTVISNGSTLGHASAINQHLFVYAIDTAAGVELAYSNLPPDYPGTFGTTRLTNTTAEGGAGAADNPGIVYSTTARSNVSWAPIAMAKMNNSTAGNWAAAPVQVDMAPFEIPMNIVHTYRQATTQSIPSTTFTKAILDGELIDADSVSDGGGRIQPNVAGIYRLAANATISTITGGAQWIGSVGKNGSVYARIDTLAGATNQAGAANSVLAFANGTSDYFEMLVYNGDGSAHNLTGGAEYSFLTCERVTS